MTDTPEFPAGIYPIYKGDDITTVATGLFAGRILQAEEAGLFDPGTSDLYLNEIDSAASESERTTTQSCWDTKYSILADAITEIAVADAVNKAREILGDDDFEI